MNTFSGLSRFKLRSETLVYRFIQVNLPRKYRHFKYVHNIYLTDYSSTYLRKLQVGYQVLDWRGPCGWHLVVGGEWMFFFNGFTTGETSSRIIINRLSISASTLCHVLDRGQRTGVWNSCKSLDLTNYTEWSTASYTYVNGCMLCLLTEKQNNVIKK